MSFVHPNLKGFHIRTTKFVCVEFLAMSISSKYFLNFPFNMNARILLKRIIQFHNKKMYPYGCKLKILFIWEYISLEYWTLKYFMIPFFVMRITTRWKKSKICLLLTFWKRILNLGVLRGGFWGFGCPNDSQTPSWLTLMLWWLIWPIQNDAKNVEKWLKPWHMGTQLRVLCESFPVSTNMPGFEWFSKIFASFYFGQR